MYIRGCLATDCGYTEQQIDSLSFPFVSNLFKHWVEFPPSRFLHRARYEYSPPRDSSEEMNAQELQMFMPAISTEVSKNIPDEVNEYFRKMRANG